MSNGKNKHELLLLKNNDIAVVGNCANCGVEYHIHLDQSNVQQLKQQVSDLETALTITKTSRKTNFDRVKELEAEKRAYTEIIVPELKIEISNLEARNKELTEALEEINETACDIRISSQPKVYSIIRIGEQALKEK